MPVDEAERERRRRLMKVRAKPGGLSDVAIVVESETFTDEDR
jgi:hypothetical protein